MCGKTGEGESQGLWFTRIIGVVFRVGKFICGVFMERGETINRVWWHLMWFYPPQALQALACPFSVIINCDGRGHGCWLLFLFLKLFWGFCRTQLCVTNRYFMLLTACCEDFQKVPPWLAFASQNNWMGTFGSYLVQCGSFRQHCCEIHSLLSWGKTNRDIGQDAVFLTLREVGRAKGKW